MEDWVLRAMQRWPNVPAVFGWLALDRRGRWLIRGEHITRPQIIDTINANYAADEFGRWYFQNGPQRGYMQLHYAPYVLHADADSATLTTHTGLHVQRISAVYLDEEGSLLFATEYGPGLLIDTDLEWALKQLDHSSQAVDDDQLATALDQPSGVATSIHFRFKEARLPVTRLDVASQPEHLNFVREPTPGPNERAASGAPD